EARRCLYENDDVLVMHFFMTFPNGTRDAVLYYIQKTDGLMRRIETGSTPLK
ncbi:MAG: nuclear transport factor 2 family protein, partial [Rhodobacteraceae bacterium]|nr:nuclear transport factor 2 family protein [Paracoccaceae bacterium]